jgi:hypothetical protein
VDGSLEPGAYLPGRWTVERSLSDAALGAGTFTGTATFAPVDGGLDWEEHGHLRLGAYAGPARRRLLVRDEPDGWIVRFDDGRPFHPLALRHGHGTEVSHPCDDDRYTGDYVVLGPDAFDVRWTVRGPAKDQRIESRYRRA